MGPLDRATSNDPFLLYPYWPGSNGAGAEVRAMVRRHPEIRRVLRLLRYPLKLDIDELAVALRDCMGSESACDAVMTVIQRALPGPTELNALMRAAILSQDLDGNKARRVAASLGLSIRSYFRYRSTAIELVAMAVERELHPPRAVEASQRLTPHWRKKMREALHMKPSCERCACDLAPESSAFICSFECTFCPACALLLRHACPNCGGELLPRPRRLRAVPA